MVRLDDVRIGTWGCVAGVPKGRRVMLRPDAWKRMLSSRRIQAGGCQ